MPRSGLRAKDKGASNSAPDKTSKSRRKSGKVNKSVSKRKNESPSKLKEKPRWPIDVLSDEENDVEEVHAYDSTSKSPYANVDLSIETDANDYESQIKRCKERIAEGVMVYNFEEKLKVLEARMKKRDALRAKWPNHSDAIAERFEFFDALKTFLHQDGDKNEVISTIDAIAQAYNSKTLDWVPGYVTYWSYGKQLTELREFNWEEFFYWNFNNEGSKGFWVEGLRDSRPSPRFWKRRICWPATWDIPGERSTRGTHVKVPIGLRLVREPIWNGQPDANTTLDPNRPPHLRDATDRQISVVPREPVSVHLPLAGEQPPNPSSPITGIAFGRWPPQRWSRYHEDELNVWWMIDDTGADICTITEKDAAYMVRQHNERVNERTDDIDIEWPRIGMVEVAGPPLLGYSRVRFANDEMGFQPIRAMEINLLGQNPDSESKGAWMMQEWDIIEVAIAPDPPSPEHEPTRLLGPWLRHRFYTATSPDGSGRLYILKKKRRFLEVPHASIGSSGLLPGVGVRQNVPEEELRGHVRRNI
ncbi:hypothetical protein N7528_000467 [Penicillium herquei]|nr:hypothetical protein N7528_000467 [Penicillium herquei]